MIRLPISLRTPAVAGSLLALAAFHQPAAAQVPSDPHVVKISRCIVTKPRPFSHHPTGLQIAFENTGPTVLHGVTFEVGYRTANATLSRTFEDAGTFAPNEPVDHHYPTFSDVEYAGATTASCKVTEVR